MSLRNKILDAACQQFIADKKRLETNLEILLTRSVGIGDHAMQVEDATTLIKGIVEANDCIEFVGGLFETSK